MIYRFSKNKIAVCVGTILATVLAGCGGNGSTSSNDSSSSTPGTAQPTVLSKSKNTLNVNGLIFKDLNGNGKLDPYEDWRLSVDARVDDLLHSSDPDVRMTLEEKAGIVNANNMVPIGGNYSSNEIGAAPTCAAGELGKKYLCEITASGSWGSSRMLNEFKGRYFILRANPPTKTLATWLNNFQQVAEESRLGLPAVIISNPRNHAATGIGLSEAAGVFSYWPGTLGMSATHDIALIKEFAQIAAKEWRATGIQKGYMYQSDLATEPRWTRNNGTFGDDPDWVASITTALVQGFQGDKISPTSVALTMKHFPGCGSAPRGIDSHGAEGKFGLYPTAGSLVNYFMKPFKAAVAAGVSSIMPCYQAPSNSGSATQLPQSYWYSSTQQFEEVGMSYNSRLLSYFSDLSGFKGYLNTDSQIAVDTGEPWGVETLLPYQRIAKSLNSGVSLLSIASYNLTGDNTSAASVNAATETEKAVNEGLVSNATLDSAVGKLLKEMIQLGLFENPYVDVDAATSIVKSSEFQAKANIAHRESIVLLKNEGKVLPLASSSDATVKIYAEVFAKSGAATATDSLRALIKATYPNATIVTDYTQATHSILLVQPTAYTGTDSLGSYVKIALDTDTGIDINKIKTIESTTTSIVAINESMPWLVDQLEPGAKALVATYDVLSSALLDVLTGAFKPTGRLPMSIPKNQAAIDANAPDVPGHLESFDYAYKDAAGNSYAFGFGLNYQ